MKLNCELVADIGGKVAAAVTCIGVGGAIGTAVRNESAPVKVLSVIASFFLGTVLGPVVEDQVRDAINIVQDEFQTQENDSLESMYE